MTIGEGENLVGLSGAAEGTVGRVEAAAGTAGVGNATGSVLWAADGTEKAARIVGGSAETGIEGAKDAGVSAGANGVIRGNGVYRLRDAGEARPRKLGSAAVFCVALVMFVTFVMLYRRAARLRPKHRKL